MRIKERLTVAQHEVHINHNAYAKSLEDVTKVIFKIFQVRQELRGDERQRN